MKFRGELLNRMDRQQARDNKTKRITMKCSFYLLKISTVSVSLNVAPIFERCFKTFLAVLFKENQISSMDENIYELFVDRELTDPDLLKMFSKDSYILKIDESGIILENDEDRFNFEPR